MSEPQSVDGPVEVDYREVGRFSNRIAYPFEVQPSALRFGIGWRAILVLPGSPSHIWESATVFATWRDALNMAKVQVARGEEVPVQ